jgi:hypothetical protein
VPEYPYKNIPLTPTVARYHILKYLSSPSRSVAKRDELAKYAEEQHQNAGGKSGRNSTGSVKKALIRLVDEGKVVRLALGHYSLPREGLELVDTDSEIVPPPEPIEQDSVSDDMAPNETIGEGEEFVYVYLSWTPKMRQVAKVEPCP